MTTHTLEGIGQNWGELTVRPAKVLKHLGHRTLSAVSSGQVGFEAMMTRATTPRPDLQRAAHRGEIAPAIRDRLLAQGAIHSYFEDQ